MTDPQEKQSEQRSVDSMNEQAQQLRDKLKDIDLGEATFIKLLAGIVQQCYFQLGLIPNPITGTQEVHLESAKYSIDLLDTLNEKTKNNLADEEKTYLDTSLYDLRMIYIGLCKQK